jgi:hypothetical protein
LPFNFFLLQTHPRSGIDVIASETIVEVVKKAGSDPEVEQITVKFAYISFRQILMIIHYFYGKRRYKIRLHFTADGSNLRNGNPRTTIAVVVEPATDELLKMQSKQVCFFFFLFSQFFFLFTYSEWKKEIPLYLQL